MTTERPKRIGIYGISAAGKSTYINQLRQLYDHVYEGSAVIFSICPEAKFKSLDPKGKEDIRVKAIESITSMVGGGGNCVIISGHHSFPKNQGTEKFELESVMTDADRKFFSDIIYLDASAVDVHYRLKVSAQRLDRPNLSVSEIGKWLEFEKEALSAICLDSGIILHKFTPLLNDIPSSLKHLVDAIVGNSEVRNRHNLKTAVEKLFGPKVFPHQPEAFLLIDGDRTLSDADTGHRFWTEFKESAWKDFKANFMKHGYSYHAFLQAAATYSSLDPRLYEFVAGKVARETSLHAEFVQFLNTINEAHYRGRVVPVIVSSGIAKVWQKLLDNNFDHKIPLIAGNLYPSGSEYILDAKGKAHCLQILKKLFPEAKFFAFGDSEADLLLLNMADQAFMVTDETNNRALRSRLIEPQNAKLANRIREITFTSAKASDVEEDAADQDGIKSAKLEEIIEDFRVPQDSAKNFRISKFNGDIRTIGSTVNRGELMIPVVSMSNGLSNQEVPDNQSFANFKAFTDLNTSKILATASRRSNVGGIQLIQAHGHIGHFLANKIIEDFVIEPIQISHIQGNHVTGFGIKDEASTAIVAMMRGGEPMARGIWALLPSSVFIHYNNKSDLEKFLRVPGAIKQIIVVDSVINEGKSMGEILGYLASGGRFAGKIFVAAGVVQDEAAKKLPVEFPNVNFYALRTSSNKYKGIGGTDTGHRLFNTQLADA